MAVVRCPQTDDKLTISLPLAGRIRNLDRPKSEALGKALGRLHSNTALKADKKSKKRASQAPVPAQPQTFVGLYSGPTSDSALVSDTVTNEEAWQHGRLLVVGTQQYIIDLNPPIVDKVELPGLAMIGYPICPVPTLSFADETLSQWQWYRNRSLQITPATGSGKSSDRSPHGGSAKGQHHFQPAAETAGFSVIAGAVDRLYVPVMGDQGCILRVQCTPGSRSTNLNRQGQPCSAVTAPVQPGPGLTAAAHRHPLTPHPLARPGVRVVTYNILADQYASREHAQRVLFGYCPKRYLDPDYRRPLILLELLGFHADIICLQEMDEKAFSEYFLPQLQQAGFDGHYTNKASSTREGEATFFRMSRFTLAAKQDVILKDCFRDLLHQSAQEAHDDSQAAQRAQRHAQFEPMLRSSPQLQQVLHSVATVAQMTLLEPVQSTKPSAVPAGMTSPSTASASGTLNAPAEGSICVVNSHFFFHPRASHVRNMHVAAVMSEVQAFIHQTHNSSESSMGIPATTASADGNSTDSSSAGVEPGSIQRPALLFCGDFNSGLNDGTPGVVQLLNSGKLPHDYWDWDFSAGFSWGPDAEEEEAQPAKALLDVADAATSKQAGTDDEAKRSSSSQDPAQVNGISLSIPFQLRSADELQSPFTNYVRGYSGLLDYIWYEPQRLRVERAIPLPSLEEVQAFIPSQRFPSDHLSVVYDLTWRETKAEPDSTGHSDHASPGAKAAQPNLPAMTSGQAACGETRSVLSASEALAPATSTYPIAALSHNSQRGVSALQNGGVIALPTDTLYGLAADAASSAGIQHIYSIKQRQAYAPLAICVADVTDLQRYCHADHLPEQLLQQLLPGPVTLILKQRQDAPLCDELNPGLATIGVRIPDSDFIRGVCRDHGGAIALTSANTSGSTSPLCVNDFVHLWPLCSAVFNGKRIQADRAGSTIIDLSVPNEFKIVRQGVSLAHVRSLLLQNGFLEKTWV